MRVSRAGVLAYLLAVTVVVLDQVSKHWVLNGLHLADRGVVELFGPFRFTFVQNEGVSFGLFRGEMQWIRWALAAFSFVVAVGLALWARKAHKTLTGAAVGLVMGGAVGNLIDRVRFGWVVDFIDVQALHFPWIFNIADSGITVGVGLLILEAMLAPGKPARPAT